MQLKLTISHTDGTSTDVTTQAKDHVAFERRYNERIGAVFNQADGVRYEYLLFLAYAAECRTNGSLVGDDAAFDVWVDTVEFVGDTAEEEPARPSSRKGRSPSQ
jgi:hypothetical protein